MTFSALGVANGPIGFYKEIIERAVLSGWSRVESVGDRGALTGLPTEMQTCDPIDLDVTGFSVNVWFDLPLMYVGAYTAFKNQTIPVVEGVDFDFDKVRGRLRLRVGGAFDNGVGLGVGRFTMPTGYEIKRGWTVLGSPGVSGQETLRVGLRFRTRNGNVLAPDRAGPRWTLFRNWTVGVSDYDAASASLRNAEAEDVCQYVPAHYPVDDVQITVTADRIISCGRAAGLSAWAYAGTLRRFRPVEEQDCAVAMMGNQGTALEATTGPVGATSQAGTMGANHGAVWLYDLARFSGVADPVELNANRWSFDAGDFALGYTPSRRLVNNPAAFGAREYYFELHDVVAARNVSLPNAASNVVYGAWDGLKTCLVADAKHGLELDAGADGVYRLWAHGSSWTKFVAAAKV